MPHFRYEAYDAKGSFASGEIAAGTREGALETLTRRGQIPVRLGEAQAGAPLAWWQREVFASGRVGATHLATFTRELASLVKADIPIDEALRIVALQPMLPARLRQLTKRSLDRVVQGEPLSDALAAEAPAFPEYYTRLIKAGEASGALADVLSDLAQVVERAAETRARVGSALLYPAILLVAAVIAMAVILTVLVPTILPIFADAGTEPPVLIRMLSSLQAALVDHWMALLAALAAITVGIGAMLRSASLRLALDRQLVRLPLLGSLIERRETARLARTLAVLTRNGVPILDSLRIASGVLSNRAFSAAVVAASEDVKEGGSLTAPLTRSGLFPDLYLRLTAVGEKTGQVDTMQLRVAEIYEAAVERQVERLTSLITPVLTLLIGGAVGGLIISVMGAIFAVNDLALK